jgi:hypothetical protein
MLLAVFMLPGFKPMLENWQRARKLRRLRRQRWAARLAVPTPADVADVQLQSRWTSWRR